MINTYEEIIREIIKVSQEDIIDLSHHSVGYKSPHENTPLFRAINNIELLAKAIL